MERTKNYWISKKTFDTPFAKKEPELRYYISSLDIDIELFSNAIRNHWSVENILHGHLDMTFKQDNNSTVDKEALFGLQLIKKISLGLLKPISKGKKISMNKLRLKMAYNIEKGLIDIKKFYAR